jgi:hypothetical protein
VDFVPVFESGPAVKLASSILANRSDKVGVTGFLAKTERTWCIKVLWTVNCETIRGSIQKVTHKRNISRVASKMSMQVPDATGHELLMQTTGLGKVDQVPN